MTGGAAGTMLAVENGIAHSGRMAMRYGVSRGVFSNEAGLGAAGISAAAQIRQMRCIRDISA